MSKLKKLKDIAECSWIIATGFIILIWLKFWAYGFMSTNYVIKDKFIYIGVLGGWIFIEIFYIAIFFSVGWYMIRLINNIYISGISNNKKIISIKK